MKLLISALSLGAIVLGCSAASAETVTTQGVEIACDGGCDHKPEQPASFDVACEQSSCNNSSGGSKLRPDLPDSFDVACDGGGCNHRPTDGTSDIGGKYPSELPESFDMACEVSCDKTNGSNGKHRPDQPVTQDVACSGNDGCVKDDRTLDAERVACETSNCNSSGSTDPKARPDQSFDVACDDASCNNRPKVRPDLPGTFDTACDGTCDNKPEQDKSFDAACDTSACNRPEPVVKPFRMACGTSDC